MKEKRQDRREQEQSLKRNWQEDEIIHSCSLKPTLIVIVKS